MTAPALATKAHFTQCEPFGLVSGHWCKWQVPHFNLPQLIWPLLPLPLSFYSRFLCEFMTFFFSYSTVNLRWRAEDSHRVGYLTFMQHTLELELILSGHGLL